VSTAFFEGQNSVATYHNTLQSDTVVKKLTFQFRTYARNGIIFQITGSSDAHFIVKLIGTKLVIDYKISATDRVMMTTNKEFSDAHWYTVQFTEGNTQTSLLVLDDKNVTMANQTRPRPANGGTLDAFIRNSGLTVEIGARSYQGCLREVRLQGILMPFFRDELFVNNTSVQKFILQTKTGITDKCEYQDGCGSGSCPASTSNACIPDYYGYSCNCSHGYEGRWCQNRMDYCADMKCVHGKCSNFLDEGRCQCFTGYAGDTYVSVLLYSHVSLLERTF